MKKSICMSIFSLFLCAVSYAEEEVKTPESFKNTLLVWNQLFENINKKLSTLENTLKTKVIQQKEFDDTNNDMKNSIANLNARIDKVEKTDSILKTNNIEKSFEDIIGILNKRSAEMEKRLETLEVNVSVIENIYRVSQKPLETLMKVIDKQATVINKIEEKLKNQEEMLLAMQKEKGPQDMATHNETDNQLESAVTSVEEKSATLHESVGDTKTSDTEMADAQKSSGPEKDVFIKNVGFYSTGSTTKISGEIINKSIKDYPIANIEIQLYDENDNMLKTLDVVTTNFKSGSTNTFDEFIFGIAPESITRHVVLLNNTELTSDSEEIDLQKVEKKKRNKVQTEKVQTEAKTSHSLPSEEKMIKNEVKLTPVKDEKFKAIGNDFYVRNVTFTESGSSTVMAGEIKNDSRESAPIASFGLKIFGEDSSLKFETQFSIISIDSNGIKPFTQTIDDILPSQISEYKIENKKK